MARLPLCPRAARAVDEGGRRDEHEAEHEDAEEEEHADHAGHRRLAARRLAAAAALGARLEARGLCVCSQRRPGPWKKHMSPSPDTALLAAEAAHPVRCAAMRTCAASHGHGVDRYGNSELGTGTGTA